MYDVHVYMVRNGHSAFQRIVDIFWIVYIKMYNKKEDFVYQFTHLRIILLRKLHKLGT